MPLPIEDTIGSAGDYADINAWVSARAGNFTVDDKVRKGTLISNINVASTQVISGATTSPSAYWHLTSNIDLNSDGSGGRRIDFSSTVTTGFAINDAYSRIEKFRLDGDSGVGGVTDVGVDVTGTAALLQKFHVTGVRQSAGVTRGVYLRSSNKWIKCCNGIVSEVHCTGANSAYVGGVVIEGSHPHELHNISVYNVKNGSSTGNSYGISFDDRINIIITNCLVGEVGSDLGGSGTYLDYQQNGDTALNVRMAHNTSEDLTAGTLDGNSEGEIPTNIWVNPANGDFTLKTGSEGIGSGRKWGVNWGYHRDASGKSRQFVTSWDKGALQKETEPTPPATAYIAEDSFSWDGSEIDASSFSFNNTPASGSNRILIVCVAIEDAHVTDKAVSSVKIGVTNFTKLKEEASASNQECASIWGLVESDIPAGESQIDITMGGICYRYCAVAFTLVNTDLSLIPQATATDSATGVCTLTVTPTSNNTFILAWSTWQSMTTPLFPDANEDAVWWTYDDDFSGSVGGQGAYMQEAPASLQTLHVNNNSLSVATAGACVVLGSAEAAGSTRLVNHRGKLRNLNGGILV